MSQATKSMKRFPITSRQGNVTATMALTLPIMAVLAAFAINSAHMQLTKTELMVATDAAARAGGRAFSETQDVNDATDAAVITGALNMVNGAPLRISSEGDEIEFGFTTQPSGDGGRYVFQPVSTSQAANGNVAVSAVSIQGRRDNSSLGGKVDLIIPGMLNMSSFDAVSDAVAMQVDRDISLILDRSGSMEWPTFDWPSGQSPWNSSIYSQAAAAGILYQSGGYYYYSSGQDSTSYQTWVWEEHFELGPAPPTPWEDLVVAVDGFLNVLEDTPQEEQVSIASYSNHGSLDSYLEYDYNSVRATVDSLNTGGATAIGRGMEDGIDAFHHSHARAHASKTLVVMTDGNHNTGTDPVTVAENFVAQYDVTIHTVTFGGGANQSLMQEVAAIGEGKHYHAETGAELIAAFREIANNLPTILTK